MPPIPHLADVLIYFHIDLEDLAQNIDEEELIAEIQRLYKLIPENIKGAKY